MSSSSQAYQHEEQNDARLKELSNKISLLRGVTNDIHAQASDHSLIDATSDSFSDMATSLKGSADRLLRSAKAAHPIFKTAGLAIFVILLLYTLYKVL